MTSRCTSDYPPGTDGAQEAIARLGRAYRDGCSRRCARDLGREIRDLEPLTEGIVERIGILSHALEESLTRTLAEFELDRRAFHVLGRLRSYGPPYQRSAGMLAKDMRLSTGAMTNRLDRMEEAGLIRRLPDPSDRRGTLIEPTDAGHAAWDRSAAMQARREATITSVLSPADREQLHGLLRQLCGPSLTRPRRISPEHPNRSSGTATRDLVSLFERSRGH